MNYFSRVLFASSLLIAGITQAVNISSVSAEPFSTAEQITPILPTTVPGRSATSPQLQPGLSPDQPIKPKIRYECKSEANKLSTVAHTERGMIELIVWESNYFGARWSPAVRCSTVTQRFQTFSDQKLLQFISTGNLNNYNVICVSGKSGDCIDQGLLITLEARDQPTQVLRQLFNYKTSIRRGPQTKEVIDVERLLNERVPVSGPETSALEEVTPSP
ncbi:MAG: hypothetical protein HC934_00235 [Acaryochloridaceae cyanobacterium SU_2_1]|nr:hypothetical protein [Acaryochloridaceae cyanobacterium SU_2_1]NJM95361.1 hypothetical protein [Acaryochloridaceae cyanobacterium CSU_5_19]